MGLNKPTFKVNVAASKKSTERKTLFLDIKPDTSVRLRILPPVTEDGMIFAKAVNHFKLKNEEGFGLALACLDEHGDENTGTSCYLCNLVKMLRNGDKAGFIASVHASANPTSPPKPSSTAPAETSKRLPPLPNPPTPTLFPTPRRRASVSPSPVAAG